MLPHTSRLYSTGRCGSAPAAAHAVAGQAADDDVKDSDDAVDDGLDDSGNAVDDGHESRADGLEDRLDTGHDSAHCERVIEVVVGAAVMDVFVFVNSLLLEYEERS